MNYLRKNYFRVMVCFLIAAEIYAIMSNRSTGTEAVTVFCTDGAPTLILDPGHGGADGGAVSLTGTKESCINLDIALRLRELCRFFGLPCRMTREREELDYPPEADSIAAKKRWDTYERVKLINEVENGFLLSIHQNTYPSPEPGGPQVFYNAYPPAGEAAQVWQTALSAAFCPDSRRLASPISEDIYIMNHATCPAVLAECGFLSNPREAAALETDTYRMKTALVLMTAYLRFREDTFE